jgi:hypothetical protein
MSEVAFAWGRRGHEIISSLAVELLNENDKALWLRHRSFDMGYYANVPDIIWRNLGEDITKVEGPQHFFDWTPEIKKTFGSISALPENFDDYKAKLGEKYRRKDGLLIWRIGALAKKCSEMTQNLEFEKQGPLLVCLGVLSHYLGDMTMPLHTSDNHDGQKTGQKGVHSYFEDTMVEALGPDLKPEVFAEAQRLYAKDKKLKLSTHELVLRQLQQSNDKVDELLKIDRRVDRKDVKRNRVKFKQILVKQLAQGAVFVALVWRDIVEPVKKFKTDKFFFFDGCPSYIEPGFEGTINWETKAGTD